MRTNHARATTAVGVAIMLAGAIVVALGLVTPAYIGALLGGH